MRKIIVGTAMAIGIFSVGAVSAFAADSCGKCTDQQAMQQFTQETEALTAALKAKNSKLRQEYIYDSIDPRKVSALEADITALKEQVNAVATKYGISACSRS